MSIQFPDFPDPSTTQEWYNTVTKEWYDWNSDTQAWRRRSASEGGGELIPDPDVDGHQDGTLDDRYVEIEGDTMKGDLIQLPSDDIYPSNEGELATAVPGGTELEFRYMNSSGDVVCASLPFETCGKSSNPVIGIVGVGPGVADYGNELELISDGVVPNATLTDQVWEVSDDGINWSNSSATAPPANYTVDVADRGKMIRVAQNFSDDTDGSNTTLFSNAISVTDAPPPFTKWIGWTHTNGQARISITRVVGQDSSPIYKNDSGDWNLVEEVLVSSKALDPGTYVIAAEPLSSFNFMRSDASIQLTLTDGSYTEDLQSMANAFYGLQQFNQDLGRFNWSSVTRWDDAFNGCTNYNSPASNLVHSGVSNIARMFKGSGFSQAVSGWDTSGVTDMTGTFENSPFNQSVAGWDTSSVISFAAMFYGTTAFNQDVSGFNISSATDMSAMFRAAKAFNTPISSWVFPAGCNVAGMFAYTEVFNAALTFNTGALTRTAEMFEGAKAFDHSSIDGLDVGNVTDMEDMFKGAVVFNQSLNSWNTGNVENMCAMFANAKEFNGNITGWNTSSVTNFKSTFYYCEKMNQSLNSWNTGSATTMESMFYRTREFNQPLDKWNTALVSNMDKMFSGCWEFYQDISTWCVPLINSQPQDFVASSNADLQNHPERLPQWGTCPPRILTNPVIK